MLSLFRNNQVTTTIPLAIYVILTHLAALLGYIHPPEGVNAGGGLLYGTLCSWGDGNAFLSAVAAAVLVFIQALLVNNLADEFRLLSERSWLPGLFYALVAACFPDFLFLSPPLVALLFVPVALRRIFKAYKIPHATALIFDAAFWMTMGSMFYPPAFFLLLAAYIGVNLMRAFNIREQLVFFTGVLIPLFLIWLGYFCYDLGESFFDKQYSALFGWYHFTLKLSVQNILKGGLLVLLLCTVLLSYGIYFYRKLIHAQKCNTVLYWFLFIGGGSILLQQDPIAAHFLLIMPSVGIFLGLSFASLRNRLIAEIFHVALLATVLFIQFFPG